MKKIKIDVEKWIDTIKKDEAGDFIFQEEDIFRFIIDTFDEAGIDAELEYRDTDYILIIFGYRCYVSSSLENPRENMIDIIRSISDEINSSISMNSWYTYSKGEHFISFQEKKQNEEVE